LVIGLRSLGRALRVLVPGLIGVLVAVALLRMAGEALSLFHLVSLLLVVGIGIDYGLFFSRDDRDPSTRGRTFHGLAVCALSTVAVFGIL
ncbi:MAG: xanthomonadin transporter, partial [Gammaproteobacteria bacterium]|nr:xanthomonadin transporter [Gemmatimonadota bacterium]NIU79280.1 xanthomonadin transporter [Gammaproteobacteria bacterium]